MQTKIRRMEEADRAAVMRMADRLQEGVAPWRAHDAVVIAVRGWVTDSVADLADPGSASFVAERGGEVVGFVCVSERAHFAGEVDTYIGELVVAASAESTGVGRSLVGAAEAWGHARGRRRIVVDTGAANARARGFYAALGFQDEDVTLSREIGGSATQGPPG